MPEEQGRIGRTMAGSVPYWPPRPAPPSGAPNVVVMLVDDVGFSDIGCFGSEIRTPALDALAAQGVRFVNFHVNPMCSPTRASLLTGMNAHAVGIGHVAQDDPGYPGYRSELAADIATAAERFRAEGYATLMVGKWHLCRDADVSAAGPQHSWPCQRGFDRFYGFLDAFTNLHHPHRLVRDNSQVEIDRYPDGYFLTDDLTDQAISMIRETKASNPAKPFFLYVAHGAAHAPLVAKPDDIARYIDTYDCGWDEIRRRRHARQIELGVIPPGTVLAPRNTEAGDDVAEWDALGPDERRLYARYMAVYAAMVDEIDQSMARLQRALDEMGEWDNTIVVFLSDNGASREGESTGTTNYYHHLAVQTGGEGESIASDLARLDLVGGPQTMVHYPRGWAMAGNTPFRLYKRNTHSGGHSVPCIWWWGERFAGQAGTVRTQYGHCIDVLPTLLDLIGLPVPELHGRSLAEVLADPAADEVRVEQYYELAGHRGLYRDGWEVVTRHQPMTPFGDHEWELYDLRNDPTETVDLAGTHADRVAALAAAWEAAAHANQVYPLDEGSRWRYIVRPPHDAVFSEPVTIWPGTPTLERFRSSRLIWSRDVVIRIAFRHRPGDRGYLLAHGDQGGGYGVYVDADRVVFVHNDGYGRMTSVDGGAIPEGTGHDVVVVITAPGGRRWNVTVAIDGTVGGSAEGLAMPFPMAPFEGIDLGIDRRSPVSWEIYERDGTFAYTGTVAWARYEPGELAPDSGDRWVDYVRAAGAKFE